jgi:hypothetical protein
MKPDVEYHKLEDQTVEIGICIIISILLIVHFLFKSESAVMKTVVANDVVEIKRMIEMSEDLDEPGPCHQTRSLYTTPLVAAAWLGRTEIIKELLNSGANVNARDTYGTTPLLATLTRGDIPSALALLNKGADPNLATCLGHGSCTTALRCARRLENPELIHRIESAGGCEGTPFFFAFQCFWMDIRPVLLMVLTRIVPVVFFIMLFGSFIRRKFKNNQNPQSWAAGDGGSGW